MHNNIFWHPMHLFKTFIFSFPNVCSTRDVHQRVEKVSVSRFFFVLLVLPCYLTQWAPTSPWRECYTFNGGKNIAAWWNVNILKGDHKGEENIEYFMSEVSSLRYQFIIALDNRDSIIYVPFRSWENCRRSTICLNLIKVWVRPGGRWGESRERGRVEKKADTGWLERWLYDSGK